MCKGGEGKGSGEGRCPYTLVELKCGMVLDEAGARVSGAGL